MSCVGFRLIFLLVFLLAPVFANDIAHVLIKLLGESSNLNYVFVNNLKSDIANDHFRSIMQTLKDEAPYTAVQHYAKYQGFIGGQVDIKILFIEEANDVCSIEELPLNVELVHPELERRHLIVLLNQNGNAAEAMRLELQQIFAHYLHTHYQIDVTVLLLQHFHTEASQATLYTFFPYTRTSCLSTQPVRIPMELALSNPEELFPKKLKRLHGCSLSVIVQNAPPTSLVDWNTKTLIGGYEAALLQFLANRLQFKLDLRQNEPPDKLFGEVYTNGSMTGVFPILNERRANFSIGLYFTANRYLRFGTSYSYFYTTLMYLTRSGRLYTPGELLLLPFDLSTWLLFLLCTTVHLILHYDLLRFPKIRSLRRFYLALWLLACIVLRSSYEGLVFRFLHKEPHHPMPTTLAQLQDQGFHLLIDSGDLVELTSIDDHFYSGHLSRSSFEISLDTLLIRYKYEKAVSVFLCQRIFFYFNENRAETSGINILTENYKFSPVCMYFPPFSYLANAFNPLLLRVAEVGLLYRPSHKFFDGMQLSCGLSIQKLQKWFEFSKKFEPISFDFIKWILGSLLVFYLVAIFVFFIEICWGRSEYVKFRFIYKI